MALEKEMILQSGISANYWRIGNVVFVPKESLQVSVLLYLDAEARVAGKDPCYGLGYSLPVPQEAEVGGFLSYCYEKLKLLPEFSEAIDA